jgi:hypothetical protein
LKTIESLGRRYEVVVWELVMPHLIRNAPALASETVTNLQDNRRIEKQLLDGIGREVTGTITDQQSKARLITASGRLAEVLSATLDVLEAKVSAAFDALPDEQRQALTAIVEHELSRVDGGGDAATELSISRATQVLETDRSSLPIPRPPHAVGEGSQ